MTTKISAVPVKNLWDSYNIGRTKFYEVLTKLQITPIKREGKSYITGEEKEMPDKFFQLGEDAFFGVKSPPRTVLKLSSRISTNNDEQLLQFSQSQWLEVLQQLIEMISSRPVVDTYIDKQKQLLEISALQLLITSSEVKRITGLKTLKAIAFQHGSFLFTPMGKIGNQKAWQVEKI